MKATPFLNDPAPGWQHDLPGPDDIDSNFPESEDNIIYLEFKIDTFKIRGLLAWLGIILIISSLILQQDTLALLSDQTIRFDIWIFSIASLTCAGGLWGGVVAFRTDVFLPRHESIRFNRARRKVYLYHYKSNWRKPFSREWRVNISTYCWQNMHAEACERYGAMGAGGHMEAVMLSTRLPGTRDIAHRFLFSHQIAQGSLNWEVARRFMQTGHIFPSAAEDRNYESAPLNLFWRFAPKVDWPADIDLESRTAP